MLTYLDILTDPKVAGPHRRVQSLAAAMRHAGHHPTVLLPRGAGPSDRFWRELANSGVDVCGNGNLMQVRHPRLSTVRHNVAWAAASTRLLARPLCSDRTGFDVVVLNGVLNFWVALHRDVRNTGIMLVVNDTLVPRRVFSWLLGLVGDRVHTVFQTPSVRQFYHSGAVEKSESVDWHGSLDLMPPGVDFSLYRPRTSRNASGGEWKIGTLCQVSSRKGLEDGFYCAIEFARRNPGIHVSYRIAGERLASQAQYVSKLDRMRDEAPANCAIEFLGFLSREESAAFLSTLDVMLLPSRSESFPQVVVQAQAVGVPVVAYAIPGVVDQVSHTHSGLLARPFDRVEFLAAMTAIFNDREAAARMVENARAQARQYFSLDANVDKFCRIARHVVDRRCPGRRP